jgi:hypothetical protein
MWRRLLLAFAAFAALTLVASSANGRSVHRSGDVTKPDKPGDVKKTPGLSAAQRAALDITSVHVTGDKRLGVLVDVKFKGNYALQIGKGKLKSAGVALVLGAKPSLASAGMFNFGPGRLGETLYRTKSMQVGTVRAGNDLTFFLRGLGFDKVDSISVKSFVDAPFTLPRYNPGGDDLSSKELKDIIRDSDPEDLDLLTHGYMGVGGLDDLSCDELDRLVPVLDDEIAKLTVVQGFFGSSRFLDDEIAALQHMRADAEDILNYDCGPPAQLSFEAWYYHLGTVSYVCDKVMTTPAWSGAAGIMNISGPGVLGPTSKSFTLGTDGSATVNSEINQYGPYHFDTTITGQGKTVTGTYDLNVTATQGSRPCPPP